MSPVKSHQTCISAAKTSGFNGGLVKRRLKRLLTGKPKPKDVVKTLSRHVVHRDIRLTVYTTYFGIVVNRDRVLIIPIHFASIWLTASNLTDNT